MIKYWKVEQGTDEWHELRKWKLTASHATAIGANGKGLDTYCRSIVEEAVKLERSEIYTNTDMQRGNRLEPIARSAYELHTGSKVYEVGGITNNEFLNCWASPDGLVGADGGVEIKARNDSKHFGLLIGDEKEIPFNQIQMSLLISEREWWDFVSINTNFDKPLFIKRIYPDLAYFEKLKSGIVKGNELIKKYYEQYKAF